MRYDLVLRSRRTVLPEGERSAAVAVLDGRIAAVAGHHEPLPAWESVDLGDDALLPGLVDTHVHVNEPGRTRWEGFRTATAAAAAGGVTTLIDMPLNAFPPTVDVAALAAKRAAAAGRCAVDVGFWGGAVPGNGADLAGLHAAGVFGFKCFLSDSGVPEFPPVDPVRLAGVLRTVARLDSVLLVHAEDPARLAPAPDSPRYRDFLACRPDRAEVDAVARLVDLATGIPARLHVLHVSSARAAAEIGRARDRGLSMSAETCPHYLVLDADQVPAGATQFKCCPPIRDRDNQDELWAALGAGLIDCVVSDHSPAPPALKLTGSFATAWGGIASLQLGLPLVWTEARRRGYQLGDVVRWMAGNPARLARLAAKGAIAVGFAADLVHFASDAWFTVDPHRLAHRHPVSPYAGRRLTGVVRDTWLSGVRITAPDRGRLLCAQLSPLQPLHQGTEVPT
jgi:allantoinase